jgi:hypothetical protein
MSTIDKRAMHPVTAASITDAIESAGEGIISAVTPWGDGVVTVYVAASGADQYKLADIAIRNINMLRVVRRYSIGKGFDYVCVLLPTSGERV